jgi:hypothetical protein
LQAFGRIVFPLTILTPGTAIFWFRFDNYVWKRITLICWAAFSLGSAPSAAESFTVHSAATVGHIEVRYSLTGAFGGYGGFIRDPSEDGAYRIPLEQEGKSAVALELCHAIAEKATVFKANELDRLACAVAAACDEAPPPTLRELSKRLGFRSSTVLRDRFSDLHHDSV